MGFLKNRMAGSHSGWPPTLYPYLTPQLLALGHRGFHRACRPTSHHLEVLVLPYHHVVAAFAAAAHLPTRRRPAAFLPPFCRWDNRPLQSP